MTANMNPPSKCNKTCSLIKMMMSDRLLIKRTKNITKKTVSIHFFIQKLY